MPKTKPDSMIQLLGKSINDPEIERLRETYDFEITDISPTIYYASYPQGFSLQFDGDVLTTIILYSEGVEDYQQYQQPLPHGVQFSFKKPKVRSLLGEPGQVGADTDIYKFNDHVMYVEYLGDGGTISSVTLMTLEKYAE